MSVSFVMAHVMLDNWQLQQTWWNGFACLC